MAVLSTSLLFSLCFLLWSCFLIDVCLSPPLPPWQSFPYERTHLSKVEILLFTYSVSKLHGLDLLVI